VLETPVILEIEGIEAGEVPLTSNIPKSLQIATRTSIGPKRRVGINGSTRDALASSRLPVIRNAIRASQKPKVDLHMMCDLTNPAFTDEARKFLEASRWPDGPFCPFYGQPDTVKPV
jgi:hypothetical protein